MKWTPDELRAQVEKMRAEPTDPFTMGKGAGMLMCAADEIERLQAELRRLRAAFDGVYL